MADHQTLITGLVVGESPRWHDGRLWLCNWGAQEVIAVDPAGGSEVVARVPTSLPFSIDWLPDGRVLIVSGPERLILRRESDGSLVTQAELTELSAYAWNEIARDGGLSNRRLWADLGDGVPDGLCLDADGAVWYADVPNRRCVRVLEGGGDVRETVQLDRGCFACMLGGADGRTLFVLAAVWHGPDRMFGAERTGQVVSVQAPSPHAGRP